MERPYDLGVSIVNGGRSVRAMERPPDSGEKSAASGDDSRGCLQRLCSARHLRPCDAELRATQRRSDGKRTRGGDSRLHQQGREVEAISLGATLRSTHTAPAGLNTASGSNAAQREQRGVVSMPEWLATGILAFLLGLSGGFAAHYTLLTLGFIQ